MDTLVFLGTGDAMGVPQVYCSCETCTEAREHGSNTRLRSSVLIDNGSDFLVIDCGPDWRRQMEAQGVRNMRRLLVTHAHLIILVGYLNGQMLVDGQALRVNFILQQKLFLLSNGNTLGCEITSR